MMGSDAILIKPELIIGRYDCPENQTQGDFSVDLLRSNIAIFGTAMSGKTTLLKTLLLRLHQQLGVTEKEEIYILDFSNNLDTYKNLPYVVAYFDAFQEENIRRIFRVVEKRYVDNISILPGKSFLDVDLDKDDYKKLCHITFIIDGLNAFMADDHYSAYHDVLKKISRDGISKGVSVIFTAHDTTNGINRLLSSFNTIVTFDVPKDQYAELYSKRVEKPIIVPGRGVVNKGIDIYEFQAYLPYNTDLFESEGDSIAVETVLQNLRKINSEVIETCLSRKMKVFTSELCKLNWEEYTDQTWGGYQDKLRNDYPDSIYCTVGLDYYSFAPIRIDLASGIRSIAIYGTKNAGKTNLLSLILESALKIDNVFFVFWEDKRQGLTRNAKMVGEKIIGSLRNDQFQMIYKWEELEYFFNLCKNIGTETKTDESKQNNTTAYNTDDGFLESIDLLLQDTPLNGIFNQQASSSVIEVEHETIPSLVAEESAQTEESTIENPFREDSFLVFVIQNREFYKTKPGSEFDQYISKLSSIISDETIKVRMLFIFSDVQTIDDSMQSTIFANYIEHAFLLCDIVRFINDKGQRSVFGNLDQAELKEKYGKCDQGDGFYYNREYDEHTKLKFIKQSMQD